MRLPTLLLLLFLSTSTFAQKIELPLPAQNADSLSVGTFKVSIDTTTKDVEIWTSDYSMTGVHHMHRRYKTSLYELDTVALIINKDSTQCEVRLLMCAGREFKVDDPYKGKIRYNMMNKKRLRLGFWKTGVIENELNETVEAINQLIPQKSGCNPKRDMRQFLCHSYTVGRDMDGVYSSGVQMPSLDGSNSVMSRHAAVQKHIDQCQLKVAGKYAFYLKFIVDEKGNVSEPFCFDCPMDIREQMYECFTQTKWKPAIYDGKKVKAECKVLLGFNVEDKYAYFEQKSKEPKKKRKPVYIPDDALDRNRGRVKTHQEEVFKVVEQMPKPVDENYFDDLTARAKATFTDKKLHEVIQMVVEKDGHVSNVKNLRSSDMLVSEWLNAYIRNTAKFTPGKQRGRAVRTEVTYKIKS